jgi:ribosome-associated protein
MGKMTGGDQNEDLGQDGPQESWEQRASKSARKREAASLQELGVQLAALPDREIDDLDLPDALCTALRDLRRLPTHGAQVRQRQPLLAKLKERKQRHDVEIRHFQIIEGWRDRLLSEPQAVDELLEEHPGADRTELTQLLGKAAKERAEQRSPSAARELFAFLRRLLD